MSEQTMNTKAERSQTYISCRLGYECVMASTKTFVNSFNNLTMEEQLEFKSLNNYVKQLEKCMSTIRNNSKNPAKVQTVQSSELEQSVIPVSAEQTEQSVSRKKSKKMKPKDVSPTAQAVNDVQADTTPTVEKSSQNKRGKTSKQTKTLTMPVQEIVLEPVKEQVQELVLESVQESVQEPVQESVQESVNSSQQKKSNKSSRKKDQVAKKSA